MSEFVSNVFINSNSNNKNQYYYGAVCEINHWPDARGQ